MDKSGDHGFHLVIMMAQPAPRPGVMSSSADEPPRLALPALLVGGIAIGFSPILVRVSELGPIATGFHRLFLALPLLWLWMRWDERHAAPSFFRKRARTEWLPIAVPGILF